MSHTSPAEGREPKAKSSTSPARGPEPTAMSLASLYPGTAPGGPKGQWGKLESLCPGLKDLCHQAAGPALEPGSDAHSEDQSSANENSSQVQGQRGPKLL
ncbi:hypothetical protein H920_10631 [Fukomys damarensis]|uniref:Uncharacterized protein n=1 Tax=Fukomys damarensis TaxID=885580 RepID=A0A091DCE7_FUKDA|nr:hypothetical protein H920_10631 [Fukomys damarensis]